MFFGICNILKKIFDSISFLFCGIQISNPNQQSLVKILKKNPDIKHKKPTLNPIFFWILWKKN